MIMLSNIQSFFQTPREINRPHRLYLVMLLNAVICTSLLITANLTQNLAPSQVYLSLILGFLTVVFLPIGAVMAKNGRSNIPVLLNTGVLLVYFAVGAYTQADMGSWYALLMFGMITAALISVYSYYEAKSIYIFTTTVSALVLLGNLFFSPGQNLVPELHRILTIVWVAIVSIYVIYALFEQFSNYSLQAKFIISVLVLAVLSIFLTVISVTTSIRQSALRDAVQELEIAANSSASEAGEFLAREIRVLETLSSNRAIQISLQRANDQFNGVSESDIQAQLLATEERWVEADDDIRILLMDLQTNLNLKEFERFSKQNLGLLITNQYGGLLATTGNPDQFYYGQESWFFRAYAGGYGSYYVSNPYVVSPDNFRSEEQLALFERDGSVVGVDIAVPILTIPENSVQAKAVGVVKTTVIINELLQALNRDIGASHVDLLANNQLFDINGDFIEEPSTYELSNSIVEQINANDFALDEFEGSNRYIVYATPTSTAGLPVISNLEWLIIVSQPQETALALVKSQQRVQLLIGLVIVLVGGVAAALVGRLVSTPILRLTEVAERVAQGERDIRVEIETGDEIATLAHSFNQMVTQIENNERNLEQRVAERTRALEISARVGRSLATIIDRDELISAVVQQIQQAFNYYHVHIYLLAKDGEYLEMVGGSGEAGKLLLQRQHKLPITVGLVGQAALNKRPIWAPDVTEYPSWQANDLLPDTKAEIAVPIMINERILGVIDVQNNRVDSLNLEDVEALQILAYQIAIALRNAELYAQLQQDANHEQLINRISQKIQSTADIEHAVKVAVQELSTVLGNVQTSVVLYESRKNGHD